MDDLWNTFTLTGKVEDYLKYRNGEKTPPYADENQGPDNQGTDDRRE